MGYKVANGLMGYKVFFRINKRKNLLISGGRELIQMLRQIIAAARSVLLCVQSVRVSWLSTGCNTAIVVLKARPFGHLNNGRTRSIPC